MSPITLAVTMGDPAGIGPEVILKGLRTPTDFPQTAFVVVGSPQVFSLTAGSLGWTLAWPSISQNELRDIRPGQVVILEPSDTPAGPFVPGELSTDAGRSALRAIEYATDLALNGQVEAMVTGPINKEALALAGSSSPGHTELLRDRTQAERVVMMLCSDKLRVALVTVHQSLVSAVNSLSTQAVHDTIRITDDHLKRWFGMGSPRLAVAGLNPHAGEGGRFGREEERVILPAVVRARDQGCHVTGPLPPDTVFLRTLKGEFDAVVCMYHDQGLIPIKLLSFDEAVNVTLGLPIVRTSVDHGTAFDIAGRGVASASSFRAACRLACSIVRNLRTSE